jgi:hypothetical protein
MPLTGPAGPANYVIPSSEAKALGLISATQSTADGSIGFAGSASGYDFNSSDGVSAGTYDFKVVAAHELAEVLGRIGGLSSTTPSWRTPFDLYRFKSPGVLDFGYNDAAYFSINGGVTNLKAFNNSTSGGDRSDWQTLSNVFDVSNAFVAKGRAYTLSAVDVTSLDVLGWGGSNVGNYGVGSPNSTAFSLVSQPAGVPEPGQWALMFAGLGLLGINLRRGRNAPAPTSSAWR